MKFVSAYCKTLFTKVLMQKLPRISSTAPSTMRQDISIMTHNSRCGAPHIFSAARNIQLPESIIDLQNDKDGSIAGRMVYCSLTGSNMDYKLLISADSTESTHVYVEMTSAGSTCVNCIIIFISLQVFLSTKKRFSPVEGQGVIYV